MKVRVKVTQEHIDNGAECDDQNCPIALALNEVELLPYKYWWVGSGAIIFSNDCYEVEFKNDEGKVVKGMLKPLSLTDQFAFLLPKKTKSFIDKFDDSKVVEPFEFEIDFDQLKPMNEIKKGA